MSYIRAGKVKGVRLETPYESTKKKSSLGIRIASNRFKEGVFSIIQAAVADANVLDLFCGVGSFGLECLSRGAKYCDFVDSSKQAEVYTLKNLEKTRFSHRATFFRMKAEDFLAAEAGLDENYNLVFIDPPYPTLNLAKIEDILTRLCGILENNAIVVLKHTKKFEPPKELTCDSGKLSIDVSKQYAISVASIYFFEQWTGK